jgi:glycosyltransferase involved in cell wall biosynthesis
MRTNVLIPTCRPEEQIKKLVKEIKDNTDCNIICSCKDQSAAKNRNWCINNSHAEILIFCDDDLQGFYKGWKDDLIFPLFDNPSIRVVSARLMKESGEKGVMIDYGWRLNLVKKLFTVRHVPTACVAMRREDLNTITKSDAVPFNKPFDERYVKACYEDIDMMEAMKVVFPDTKIVVNNNCQIVHLNNEVWRDPEKSWKKNQKLYQEKWV